MQKSQGQTLAFYNRPTAKWASQWDHNNAEKANFQQENSQNSLVAGAMPRITLGELKTIRFVTTPDA
jgi:hypothetical protein